MVRLPKPPASWMRRFLSGALVTCWFLGLGAAAALAQDVVVDRNVVYYDGPEFYAPRHILDVYRQDGAENQPVLIFIHGGGWTNGNKNLYGFLGNFFASQGYVTVIANYRLTDSSPGRVVHPGHIEDVARAFAWTLGNIADYGGNPSQVFLSGHSAGGHLVSLLAVDPRYLKAHGLTPDHIAGVISLSGVYDVRVIPVIFGDPAERQDASPRYHVGDWQPPPFLVLYGENDIQGLGFQALVFYSLLVDLPSEAGVLEFPGRTHATIISRIANPGDEVAKAMLQFLGEH